MFRSSSKEVGKGESSYASIKLLCPAASGVAFTLERVKQPRLHSPHVKERDRQQLRVLTELVSIDR